MATRLGADPADLRRLATQIERAGEGLEDDARTIGRHITGWHGPDALRYRAEWDSTHRPALTSVATEFSKVAKQLRDEAAAQEKASDVDGGRGSTGGLVSGGGGGGGGGGGVDDAWEGKEAKPKVTHTYKPNSLLDGSEQSRGVYERGWKKTDTDGDGHPDSWTPLAHGNRADDEAAARGTQTFHDKVKFSAQVGDKATASGFVGEQISDQGAFGTKDGVHGDGQYAAYAGAGYDASAGVSVTKDGADLKAQVSAQVGVGANASGSVGYGEHLSASGNAAAHLGATAEASAGLTMGPNGVSAQVGANAMVGAEASASGKVEAGGLGVGGSVHAYAGAGVHASASGSFGPEKVGVKIDFGVALGVGAGASLDLSVNPKEVVDTIGDLGEGAADLLEDVGGFFKNPFG